MSGSAPAPRTVVCRTLPGRAGRAVLETGSGERLGQLGLGDPRRGALQVGGAAFRIERKARGFWRLRCGSGAEGGSAEREHGGAPAFRLAFPDARWRLAPLHGRFGRLAGWTLDDGETVWGELHTRPGFRSNRLVLELLSPAPAARIGFCLWLSGIHWVGTAGAWVAARA